MDIELCNVPEGYMIDEILMAVSLGEIIVMNIALAIAQVN